MRDKKGNVCLRGCVMCLYFGTCVCSRFLWAVSLLKILSASVLFIRVSKIKLMMWKWEKFIFHLGLMIFLSFHSNFPCRAVTLSHVLFILWFLIKIDKHTSTCVIFSILFCYGYSLQLIAFTSMEFSRVQKNARQINMLSAKRVTPIIIYGNY